MTTGQRIRELLKSLNMSQDELAKRTGYTDRSSIAKIEADKCELTESKIKLFSEVLHTTPAALIGIKENAPMISEQNVAFEIIGDVAAGYNHFAEYVDDLGQVDIPVSWLKGRSKTDYFVLRVSGDSMFPAYQDGDIVLILKQSVMDYSGQIGVVLYDDNKATLKRVEFVQGESWMKLVPVNPQFPPITIRDELLDHCEILGIPRILLRRI